MVSQMIFVPAGYRLLNESEAGLHNGTWRTTSDYKKLLYCNLLVLSERKFALLILTFHWILGVELSLELR